MKFAICQELYEHTDWTTQCRRIAAAGYTGIEVAPFTIAENVTDISTTTIQEMRETAAQFGLEIIGLHWLLAKTTGLHLTSPETEIRARTADYLRRLADLCAGLGGKVLVFGSPQQRNLQPGISADDGMRYAAEVFHDAMPTFVTNGVELCLEPLTPKETNFINTCAPAVQLIEMVRSPAMRLHQDVKAMLGAETDSVPSLIHKYRDLCGHFHVNDTNLLGPGMGETDFHPILKALQESNSKGWVSVEVFDYRPGADHIAQQSIEYMKRVLSEL